MRSVSSTLSSSFVQCSIADPQVDVAGTLIVHGVQCVHRVKRKTITIREDQDEWIEEQHLNLSSFIREKIDELIEERE